MSISICLLLVLGALLSALALAIPAEPPADTQQGDAAHRHGGLSSTDSSSHWVRMAAGTT